MFEILGQLPYSVFIIKTKPLISPLLNSHKSGPNKGIILYIFNCGEADDPKTNRTYICNLKLYQNQAGGFHQVTLVQFFSRFFCRPCHGGFCVAQLEAPTVTRTCLYNFDPFKPHFYIVKLGFTGVHIIFLIFAQKHRLWVLVRTASPRRF